MNNETARRFAIEWVESWSSHDLDRVLLHYSDSFEMSSTVMTAMGFSETGTLRGKPAVRPYWQAALDRTPDLLGVFHGVNTVVIHYRGPRGIGAEAFEFGKDGKVFRTLANYEG